MIETIRALPIGAKIAGVAVMLVIAFSGTALAGTLPDPIQDSVSDTASAVGIEIPSSDPEQAEESDEELSSVDPAVCDSGASADSEDTAVLEEETHGDEVSAVATDKTAIDGNHGGAVSAVASSNSSAQDNHGSEVSAEVSKASNEEKSNNGNSQSKAKNQG